MKTQKKSGVLNLMITILMFLIVAPLPVLSQQNRGETRKEKKEREKKEQLHRYRQARQLVFDTAFAVPAETIHFRDGLMLPAQSSINFLKMKGDEAVIQIGSDFARGPGLNNLGGVTLKGKISNLSITEKEKKNRLYMTFVLTGLIGTAQITLTLTGSEYAIVDVNGMFSGRAFTLRGPVQPLSDTFIFEGTEF